MSETTVAGPNELETRASGSSTRTLRQGKKARRGTLGGSLPWGCSSARRRGWSGRARTPLVRTMLERGADRESFGRPRQMAICLNS